MLVRKSETIPKDLDTFAYIMAHNICIYYGERAFEDFSFLCDTPPSSNNLP